MEDTEWILLLKRRGRAKKYLEIIAPVYQVPCFDQQLSSLVQPHKNKSHEHIRVVRDAQSTNP